MRKDRAPSRAPLTRDRVLRAAMAIADETGIESLSMRLLGSRLGVEAMSLYNHVANKDDLLDGIVDLVVEEIAIPSAGRNWRAAMKERAVSARRAFRRHPWASALLDSRVSSGPARLRYLDAMIGTLLGAGFPIDLAAHAFSTMDSFVYGFARQIHNRASSDGGSDKQRAAAFRDAMPVRAYPNLAMFAQSAAEKGYDEDADFEFGLELILDGLSRALKAARK